MDKSKGRIHIATTLLRQHTGMLRMFVEVVLHSLKAAGTMEPLQPSELILVLTLPSVFCLQAITFSHLVARVKARAAVSLDVPQLLNVIFYVENLESV